MNPQPDQFRMLKIVHLAILGGLTLFAIIATMLVITKYALPKYEEGFEQTLQGVIAILSLTALLVGFNLFRKKIGVARNMNGLAEERMNQYKTACITWWALIEAPGIFSVIGLLLTGNFAFLALALFHLILLAVFMPRKDNIIVLLHLTSDEVARLEGKR
jgi:hypothetical protein